MKVTKGKKRLLVAIITVLVILVASQAFKWYLSETVLDIINKNPNRKYQLTFNDLTINSFYSGFEISGIEIIPLKKDSMEITGTIRNLQLHDVNWARLLTKNGLSIHNLTINSPVVKMKIDTTYHKVVIDSARNQEKRRAERVVQDLLAGFLVNFELNNLELVNMSLQSQKADGLETYFGFESLDISAYGIRLDSVSLKYIVPFQLDSIQVSINNAFYQLNPFYKAYIGGWDFNSSESRIKLESIGIELSSRWDSVSVDLGYQTDIFDIHIDSIVMNDLRYYGDSNNIDIIGDKVTFYQPIINDYRNKNIPRKEEPVKPLFNKMIQSIPFPLSIDSLIIYNGSICYNEWPEGIDQPGKICFEKLNVNVKSLHNQLIVDSTLECTVNIETSINDHIPIKAQILIPLNSYDHFRFRAKTDTFSMRELNNTLVPLAGMDVKSGQVNSLYIFMNVDENGAQCEFSMIYNDLNIEILDDHHKKKALLSLLANTFIKKNRKAKDTEHVVNYYTRRNPKRGPFNLIWNSTKGGLMNVLPSKTAKKVIESKKG